MRRILTAIFLLLTGAAAIGGVGINAATADQHDSRLKALFDALKTADTPAKAA